MYLKQFEITTILTLIDYATCYNTVAFRNVKFDYFINYFSQTMQKIDI